MTGDSTSGAADSPGGGAEAAPTQVCPKCRAECRAGVRACPRCGLLAARFSLFAAEQPGGAALDSEALDAPWQACSERWEDPAAHDALLDQATRLECLPALARRYRERLQAGADPVAEKRLNQITVLLVHAVRAQVRDVASTRGVRVLWAFGYVVAAAVLAASVWVFFLVLRKHG